MTFKAGLRGGETYMPPTNNVFGLFSFIKGFFDPPVRRYSLLVEHLYV